MKTIASTLGYASQPHTIAHLLKVVRTDDEVRGYTSHTVALTVSAVTYEPGFDLSALSSTSTLAVDNLELTVLADDDEALRLDLLAGRWDGAFFEIAEVNWRDTSAVNVLKRGHLGEVRLEAGKFVVEFRSLTQALQQPQGIVTQKTCRARLGDSNCRIDLEDWTEAGTITAVASRREITDTTMTQEAGWFSEGMLTFTDGLNANLSRKVRSFADGIFELALPFPFDVEVGDAYTAVAGCRKRLGEDCSAKFDNVVNFYGEPHLPGLDALTRPSQAETDSAAVPDGAGGGSGESVGDPP